MIGTDNELIKKARRRIKRFIKSGEKVARVQQLENGMFSYTVKHKQQYVQFKLDKLGRLRLLKNAQ